MSHEWDHYAPPARTLNDDPGAPQVLITYRFPTVSEMRKYATDSYTAGDEYVPPVPGELGDIKKKLAWMNDAQFIRFQHGARLVESLNVGGEVIACPSPEAWLAFFEKDARYVWLIEADAEHLFRRTPRVGATRPAENAGARDVREGGGEAGDGGEHGARGATSGPALVPELPHQGA